MSEPRPEPSEPTEGPLGTGGEALPEAEPSTPSAQAEAERRADELDAPDAELSAGGILAAITQAAVDNPVTVHLVSAILIAAGLVSYFTMPREIFPEFTRERIRVMTVFPGAARRACSATFASLNHTSCGGPSSMPRGRRWPVRS